MTSFSKLNLGCGGNLLPGYLNVDKFGNPDVRHDLEVLPWPWADDSFEEVALTHVLEHLGESTATFLGIVKELYRVCKPGAVVRIVVPHPRHDDFLNDPTHIRAVTPDMFLLFSKKQNHKWLSEGYSNSPLALYLDVDFELRTVNMIPDAQWQARLQSQAVGQEAFIRASRELNNVIREIRMVLAVIK